MILLKEDLELSLHQGHIQFSGEIRKDSFLLTLGEYIQAFREHQTIVDPYDMHSVKKAYGEIQHHWKQIELKSHQLVLVSAQEFLGLDNCHFALISTLSHVARLGLMAHMSSFFVDRGYKGYLTLEVINLSPHSILLHQNMPFAKVVIFECNQRNLDQDTSSKAYHHYGKPDELISQFWREFPKNPKREI